MNSNVMPSYVQMEKEELSNLVQNVVKETVVSQPQKQFTSADMWQIQKQMKQATKFSKRWNLN